MGVGARPPVVGVWWEGELPAGFDVVGEPRVPRLPLGVQGRDAGVGGGVAEKPVGDGGQPVPGHHRVGRRRRGGGGHRVGGRVHGGGQVGDGGDGVDRLRRWWGGVRGAGGEGGRGGADHAGGDAVQRGGQPDAR